MSRVQDERARIVIAKANEVGARSDEVVRQAYAGIEARLREREGR